MISMTPYRLHSFRTRLVSKPAYLSLIAVMSIGALYLANSYRRSPKTPSTNGVMESIVRKRNQPIEFQLNIEKPHLETVRRPKYQSTTNKRTRHVMDRPSVNRRTTKKGRKNSILPERIVARPPSYSKMKKTYKASNTMRRKYGIKAPNQLPRQRTDGVKRSNNEIDLRRDKNQGQKSGWSVLPSGIVVHLGVFPNPHNYSYLIQEKELCNSFDDQRLRLLIFVESDAHDQEYRQAIRKTWGLRELQNALNFRIAFMLGNPGNDTVNELIYKESCIYGDVVQENFTEKWENLAKKSVMGLKWALSFCSRADYVVKTDQDVFIHVPNLISTVEKHEKTEQKDSALLCHENIDRKILRSNDTGEGREKYHVHDLPGRQYPTYCAGFAYAMSSQVTRKLYQSALITPEFFIEDVYVTGICRQKAGLTLISHPHLRMKPHVTAYQGICPFRDGRITSQEIGVEELRILWDGINTKGFFCPHEIDKPDVNDFI